MLPDHNTEVAGSSLSSLSATSISSTGTIAPSGKPRGSSMWEPYQWPWSSTPPNGLTMASPPEVPQDYLLKWHNHKSNLIDSLQDLVSDMCSATINVVDQINFADVTLACGDGVRLYAHRLILAASSPYFFNLFKADPQSSSINTHPYLILKDVRSEDMKLLLEYIYRGEVTVAQDELSRLIHVAKSLQVRGLAEDLADTAKCVEQTKTGPGKSECAAVALEPTPHDDGLRPEELTVSKRQTQEDVKVQVPSSCTDSKPPKISHTSPEVDYYDPRARGDSCKDKLLSRSSTPLSRNSSPSFRFVKEEITAVKSDSEFDRSHRDHDRRRHRSQSPPSPPPTLLPRHHSSMIPTPVLSPPQTVYRHARKRLHRDHQSPPPSAHGLAPPINYSLYHHQQHQQESIALRMEQAAQQRLFISQAANRVHKTLSQQHQQSGYPSGDDHLQSRLDMHPHHAPLLGIPPHSSATISPTSPPSPKRKRLGNSFPMPPLLHPNLFMNRGATPLDLLSKNSSLSEVPGLGCLSVKKDLGGCEEPALLDRDKLLSSVAGLPHDYSPFPFPPTSSSSPYGHTNPPEPHTLLSKGSREGPSPPSVTRLPHYPSINFPPGIGDPQYLLRPPTSSVSYSNGDTSISITTTTTAATPTTSSNNTTSVSTTHAPHTTTTTATASGGGGGGSSSSSNSSPANHPLKSEGGGSLHYSTPGNVHYNNSFVNVSFAGGVKPEWKRYKQYSKSDLTDAINDVKKGMTALQASRKYKVPSRTLYDKIKKLGICTTTRRITSTGSKLRNATPGKSPDAAYNMDRRDRLLDSSSILCNNSSSGGIVTEGDCDSPTAANLLPSKDESRYESSRPHSVDSSTTNESSHPLDLQIPKATSCSEAASKVPVSSSNSDLYSWITSRMPASLDPLHRADSDEARSGDLNQHHPIISNDLLSRFLPHLSSTQMAVFQATQPNEFNAEDYFTQIRNRRFEDWTEFQKNTFGGQLPKIETKPPQNGDKVDDQEEEEEDDDMDVIVDNNDHEEKPQPQNLSAKSAEVKLSNSRLEPGSARSDNNDTAYVSNSSRNNEPSSSDSPPSSSFTAADSGHDSNNDTSANSESETRVEATGKLTVKLSQASPESSTTTTTTMSSEVSPKVSEACTSGSEVSPLLSEKSSVSLDSDSDAAADRSATKTSSGSYNVVSDIGLCSQVLPLDLRETSVVMTIPQESA